MYLVTIVFLKKLAAGILFSTVSEALAVKKSHLRKAFCLPFSYSIIPNCGTICSSTSLNGGIIKQIIEITQVNTPKN